MKVGDSTADGFRIFYGGRYEFHAWQAIDRSLAEKGIPAFYEKWELPAVLQWDPVSE